jgi:hypothetical protein
MFSVNLVTFYPVLGWLDTFYTVYFAFGSTFYLVALSLYGLIIAAGRSRHCHRICSLELVMLGEERFDCLVLLLPLFTARFIGFRRPLETLGGTSNQSLYICDSGFKP